MDAWLREHLVCPRDHLALREDGASLVCAAGHRYPCIDGIPVMLRDDVPATHVAFGASLAAASLGLRRGPEMRPGPEPEPGSGVDPYVQEAVAGTCGYMYLGSIGRLATYPIPELRLPPASGPQAFLDVGCNWGRWCVSAARIGYVAVGIDPSLEAIRAARRVARQLAVPARYLVADARYLPFRSGTFDVAFSYSVLQHFDKNDARRSFAEIGRVLRPSGRALIQMPNVFGLRNLYHQLRRRFRAPRAFEVRYWTPGELRAAFTREIGPASLSVDGYLSLNPQTRDLNLLPLRYRFVVWCSMALRKASRKVPWLTYAADSLYVTAVRRA